MTASDGASTSQQSEPVDVEQDLANGSTHYSLSRAILARKDEYVRRHRIRVKVGSWNVAACPGTDKDLAGWFVDGKGLDKSMTKLDLNDQGGKNAEEQDVSETPGSSTDSSQPGEDDSVRLVGGAEIGLYVLGLQEIIALNSISQYADTSATSKWQAALEAAMPPYYKLVTSQQLSGLLLLIYASPEVADTITNVSTVSVDGLPGEDIRRLLMLHTRGEYDLSKQSNKSKLDGEDGVIVMQTEDDRRNSTDTPSMMRETSFDKLDDDDGTTDLPDPDDFLPDPHDDPASVQATIDSLLPHDQLRRTIESRKAFHEGWREGSITFLPSYKYDVGTVGLFDSSEKRRAPSWCDRILYRTRKDIEQHHQKFLDEVEAKKKDEDMKQRGIDSAADDESVLLDYDPNKDTASGSSSSNIYDYDEYDEGDDAPESGDTETVVTKDGYKDGIKLDVYTTHQRVTSSDHKPIVALFTLDYDAVVPELKAKVHAEVAKELDRAENEGRPGVTIVVEKGAADEQDVTDGSGGIHFGDVNFMDYKERSLTVANTGRVSASFCFVAKPDISDEAAGKDNALLRRTGYTSTYSPLRWSRRIDELIRIPPRSGGIRGYVKKLQESTRSDTTPESGSRIPQSVDVHTSSPHELYKLTEAIETLTERCVADENMLQEESAKIPRDTAGWPFTAQVPAPTSAGESPDSNPGCFTPWPAGAEAPRTHGPCIRPLLRSLSDGIIDGPLFAQIEAVLPFLSSTTTTKPGKEVEDDKTAILDILATAPYNNISFVFITAMIARVASEVVPLTRERDGRARRGGQRRADDEAGQQRARPWRRAAAEQHRQHYWGADAQWQY
ncbi:hypothetical protein PG994_003001 [Apiospora phragmitis]|uniref:Inositol polyphosphate-related phosphatase domain-containing protein n=1 Tax=Apiospora phragmitis TaxID=2905665 RepID=A0ABR1W6T7_9PEZI